MWRKFDTNRSILKLSKNWPSRTSVHWRVLYCRSEREKTHIFCLKPRKPALLNLKNNNLLKFYIYKTPAPNYKRNSYWLELLLTKSHMFFSSATEISLLFVKDNWSLIFFKNKIPSAQAWEEYQSICITYDKAQFLLDSPLKEKFYKEYTSGTSRRDLQYGWKIDRGRNIVLQSLLSVQ